MTDDKWWEKPGELKIKDWVGNPSKVKGYLRCSTCGTCVAHYCKYKLSDSSNLKIVSNGWIQCWPLSLNGCCLIDINIQSVIPTPQVTS